MVAWNDEEDETEEDDEFGETSKKQEDEVPIKNDMPVICGGSISDVKKILTKVGNKEMAIIQVEDLFGTFDVMVIPKVYEKYKNIIIKTTY